MLKLKTVNYNHVKSVTTNPTKVFHMIDQGRNFGTGHIRGRPLFVQATFSYNFEVHEGIF